MSDTTNGVQTILVCGACGEQIQLTRVSMGTANGWRYPSACARCGKSFEAEPIESFRGVLTGYAYEPCPSCATTRAENERLGEGLAQFSMRCAGAEDSLTALQAEYSEQGQRMGRLRAENERLTAAVRKEARNLVEYANETGEDLTERVRRVAARLDAFTANGQ